MPRTPKKQPLIDALPANLWPRRAVIGPRMVVGADRHGEVVIVEVGGNIYGEPTIRNSVNLDDTEARALAQFLAAEAPDHG